MTGLEIPPAIALLSLGGNQGKVAEAFARAVRQIDAHPHCRLLKSSSLWRTKPWGKLDQPDFLNMAIAIETSLQPEDLLTFCLALEAREGRLRNERWGPRPLDIDIITFGTLEMRTANLTVPHPRAHERAFVLAPVFEIAPEATLQSRPVGELLRVLLAQSAEGDCMRDDEATATFVKAMG